MLSPHLDLILVQPRLLHDVLDIAGSEHEVGLAGEHGTLEAGNALVWEAWRHGGWFGAWTRLALSFIGKTGKRALPRHRARLVSGLHLHHVLHGHIPQRGELGPDGARLTGEARRVQVELDGQEDVPPVRAAVAGVAPALGLEAGLRRAVRVEGALCLGEALAVRVDGAGSAGVGQH